MSTWWHRKPHSEAGRSDGRLTLTAAHSTPEVVVRELDDVDAALVADLTAADILVHGSLTVPAGEDQSRALLTEWAARRCADTGNLLGICSAGQTRLESVIAVHLSSDFVAEIATITRAEEQSRRAAIDGIVLFRRYARDRMGLVRIWGEADHIDTQTLRMFREAGFTVEDLLGSNSLDGQVRYSSIA